MATAGGAPVTQIATLSSGSYRAAVPPGDYVLSMRAEHRRPRRLEVRVEPRRFAEVPTQRFQAPGILRFAEPAFADGGPGRVVVAGVGDTPDPVFRPELLDFRLDGRRPPSGSETRELFFTATAADPRRVAVPMTPVPAPPRRPRTPPLRRPVL